MVCRSPPVGRHKLTLKAISAVVTAAADWARCGEASQKSVGLSFFGLHDLHHVCEPSVALTFQNKYGVKKAGWPTADVTHMIIFNWVTGASSVKSACWFTVRGSSVSWRPPAKWRIIPRQKDWIHHMLASSNFLVFYFYFLVFCIWFKSVMHHFRVRDQYIPDSKSDTSQTLLLDSAPLFSLFNAQFMDNNKNCVFILYFTILQLL